MENYEESLLGIGKSAIAFRLSSRWGVKRLIFLKRKKTVQAKTGSGEFHRMANIAEKEKTSPSKNRFWRNEKGGKTVEAKTGSG